MGKRRGFQTHGKSWKKPRHVQKKSHVVSDYDLVSKDDYVIIGDLMFVKPYVFEFKTHFKPRWAGKTILEVFSEEFRHVQPSYWRHEFKEGRVLRAGQVVDGTALWRDGDEVIHIVHRHESAALSRPVELVENNDDFVVVSKPPSLPIHPCGTYRRNTLQFVLKAFHGLDNLHVVHRLDKETSGLVIMAKNSKFAASFCAEIKEHKVQKTYLAEVDGTFPNNITESREKIFWERGMLKATVSEQGVDAETHFKLISSNTKKKTSIVECRPITGRSHQIRIHLAHLGFPIVNDPIYGKRRMSSGFYSDWKSDAATVKLNAEQFTDTAEVQQRRQSYRACEWSKRERARLGRPLSALEEGSKLSCLNCPQVTNMKNVELETMYIHLHALKYQSDQWSFQVAPPPWMTDDTDANANRGSGLAGWIGCEIA